MQDFTRLKVWQRSHQLVVRIYKASSRFPMDERFGLTAQLRRSAVSVPSNIAEGAKRKTRPDYARFLNIAEGSLAETEYQLLLSRDLEYLDSESYEELAIEANEIARMLNALRLRVDSQS